MKKWYSASASPQEAANSDYPAIQQLSIAADVQEQPMEVVETTESSSSLTPVFVRQRHRPFDTNRLRTVSSRVRRRSQASQRGAHPFSSRAFPRPTA
ncbi:unnamed protein product [Heligmosomoides polygyrus]|uniref:Uncharacterized protein n=1 Tax=Heligmosomoides polygyrus TaxID=6339 RepID=A0A183FBZ5_HELPZ|nr:unnamed protein product [Heligmosomoides polygyrus]